MKYILPVLMLFVLSACDQKTAEQQDINGTPPPAKVTAEKAPDYLDKPLQGRVTQHGLYRMVRSAGIVDDPHTTTGKAIASPVISRVKTTDRIPLMKGAQMYLQFRIWPYPENPAYVDLRRVLKHPQMTLPDGSRTTGSDFMVKSKVTSNQVLVYTGYGFDEDYELVEGDWVFEIWYGEKKLLEQTFTTYWPDKEEIAKLKPVLNLGNKVLTKIQTPDHPEPWLNWPRVVVGGDDKDVPAGVAEVFTDPSKTELKPPAP